MIIINISSPMSSLETKQQYISRWCIVNVYHVRFLREMFNVTNVGPISPPILSLSDGGHVENLGLLSLFQRRVEKIVVVDGGFYKRSCDYASSLLATLELARKKLHCSFAGEREKHLPVYCQTLKTVRRTQICMKNIDVMKDLRG